MATKQTGTALTSLTTALAKKLDMGGDGAELVTTLKATAFKGNVSDAQMTALMAVANQYGLNPWTKEIYAFPDRANGIIPVVGVDGWSRIINEHPQFDGVEFEQTADACTCSIYRKDRSHPTRITEFMKECSRGTGPWQTHPRRMLRHKAFIQCARLAFGYAGIYDADEAARIAEARAQEAQKRRHAPQPAPVADDDGVIDVPARPVEKAAAAAFDLDAARAMLQAADTHERLKELATNIWKEAPKEQRAAIKEAHDKRKAELDADPDADIPL